MSQNKIALLFLIAVVLGVNYFLGSSVGGAAELFGQTLGYLLIIGIFTGGYARYTKQKMRTDVTLVLAAAFLIFFNYKDITTTYDFRVFQREIKAAGKDNIVATIQQSRTQLAAMLRGTQVIAQESLKEAEKILTSIDDPAISSALAPANVTDSQKLLSGKIAAQNNLNTLTGFMPKFNTLLRQERVKLDALAENLSDSFRKGYKKSLDQREITSRSLLEKRVVLYDDLMRTLVSNFDFLISRQGQYSPNSQGLLMFQTQEDVDTYNAFFAKINSAIEQEAKLIAEAKEIETNSMNKLWTTVSDPNNAL